jgi:glutaminase
MGIPHNSIFCAAGTSYTYRSAALRREFSSLDYGTLGGIRLGGETRFPKKGLISSIAESLEYELKRIKADVPHESGSNASYIPMLELADPETFAAAVCSTSGEMYSFGADKFKFSMQSCVTPFLYLMACEELGMSVVHEHVGREPCGQAFNPFSLTDDNHPLPLNPLINSGAITACNLIGQRDKLSPTERLDRLKQMLNAMGTNGKEGHDQDFHVGFDNAVFMSEVTLSCMLFALTLLAS